MFSRMILAATASLATMAGAAMAADTTPAPRAVVVAAPVGPQPAGDIGISAGPVWIETNPEGPNLWLLNTVTRATIPLGNGWNLEGQVNGRVLFAPNSSSGFIAPPIQAGGYVHGWLAAPRSTWGVFVGVSPVNAVYTSLGVEAKTYLPRASLGAAAAATFVTYNNVNGTAWTLNANANFFVSPDSRLGLQAALITGVHNAVPLSLAVQDHYFELTADFEQRLGARPISLWLAGSVTDAVRGLNAWSVEGGVRLYFNQSPRFTLQSHDKDVPFTFVLPEVLG